MKMASPRHTLAMRVPPKVNHWRMSSTWKRKVAAATHVLKIWKKASLTMIAANGVGMGHRR